VKILFSKLFHSSPVLFNFAVLCITTQCGPVVNNEMGRNGTSVFTL